MFANNKQNEPQAVKCTGVIMEYHGVVCSSIQVQSVRTDGYCKKDSLLTWFSFTPITKFKHISTAFVPSVSNKLQKSWICKSSLFLPLFKSYPGSIDAYASCTVQPAYLLIRLLDNESRYKASYACRLRDMHLSTLSMCNIWSFPNRPEFYFSSKKRGQLHFAWFWGNIQTSSKMYEHRNTSSSIFTYV